MSDSPPGDGTTANGEEDGLAKTSVRGKRWAGWCVALGLGLGIVIGVLGVLLYVESLREETRDFREKLTKAKVAFDVAKNALKSVDRQLELEKNLKARLDAGESPDSEELGKLREILTVAKTEVDKDLKAAEQAISGAWGDFKTSFPWTRYLLLALLLCCIFPFSAMAFMFLEVPSLISQFCIDYVMLGGQPMGDSSYGRTERAAFTRRWSAISYVLHCTPTITATLLGAYLFFREPDDLLDINTQRGMQLGFLGAYIYCLNLVYRRYTTRDLQPHVYLFCAIGLIAGMVFNFVAFTAIVGMATPTLPPPEPEQVAFQGVGAGAAAILAFSLGYFPNLAIRWFSRISKTSLHERQRRSDALPLLLIDGISELHESRLKDEGIDNIQNLAAADIQNLVEKTPYSAQEVVAWIDQAVLYLYLEPSEIESFRRAGVRSITDFHGLWEGLSIRHKVQSDGTLKSIPGVISPEEIPERRKVMAQQLATTEYRLDCLFLATEEGSNMEHVRNYWANVQTTSKRISESLLHEVSGRVGRVLRESYREGSPPSHDVLLTQIAQGLFSVTDASRREDARVVTAESLYGQAYLKNQLKEISEARRLLLQCIEKFPKDPVAYNDLAWLDLHTFSLRADFERAQQYAERAVKIAEKNVKDKERGDTRFIDLAAYRDTLAFAHLQLGKPELALSCIEAALDTWKKSGRESEPRLLDTLVHTAKALLDRESEPQLLVRAAETLVANGKIDLAKNALARAERESDQMTDELKSKVDELRARIESPRELPENRT